MQMLGVCEANAPAFINNHQKKKNNANKTH